MLVDNHKDTCVSNWSMFIF